MKEKKHTTMCNGMLGATNGGASETTVTATKQDNKAPFSFHCTICIEPFRSSDRPPVVLPCGHTYLCLPCSQKLDRCMECRASLYMTPSPSVSQQQQASSTTADGYDHRRSVDSHQNHGGHLTAQQRALQARYGTQFTPAQPRRVFRDPTPKKEEPIALPLPKNLVLLELMEAADRSAVAAAAVVVASSADAEDEDDVENNVGGDEEEEDDDGYESGDDDGRVFRGLHALAGPCGTYAVRCERGLQVLDSHPNNSSDAEVTNNCGEAEIKEAVEGVSEGGDSDDGGAEVKDTIFRRILPTGATVQVVSVDANVGGDHVFELARSAGYIVASSTQLVKVGAPQDKACQIEGMLKSAALEKKELQKKLDEMNKLEDGLKKDFDRALQTKDVPPSITFPRAASSITATASNDSLTVLDDDEGIIEVGLNESFDRVPSPPTIRIVSGVGSSGIHQPPTDELWNSRHSVEKTHPLMLFGCVTRYNAEGDDSLMDLSVDSGILERTMHAPEPVPSSTPPSSSAFGRNLQRASSARASAGEPWTPERRRNLQRASSARAPSTGERWTPDRRRNLQRASSTRASSSREPKTPERRSTPVMSSPTSSPYETVNFRTGLSGHRALMSSRTNPDHHSNVKINRGETRMMGEHNGISLSHRMMRRNSM